MDIDPPPSVVAVRLTFSEQAIVKAQIESLYVVNGSRFLNATSRDVVFSDVTK